MKKVMIYAYTNLNLGDDLFIKILCERYPKTQFILMAGGYKAVFDTIPNLRCYGEELLGIRVVNNVLRRLESKSIQLPRLKEKFLLSKVDAIVYIGGSIFIQNKEWYYQWKLLTKRLKQHKPFYIVGCNFGPYTLNTFYDQYKKCFGLVKDLCFRERASYNLFSDLKNVRCAADVVFSLKATEKPTCKQTLVVSVMDLTVKQTLSQYTQAYETFIKKITQYFIQQGYVVYLMGFCKAEGDERAIKRLLEQLSPQERKYALPYVYEGNLAHALELIQTAQCIVATRFHAMILGWLFEKCVYPITYSKKSLNVMQDVAFEGMYTQVEDIQTVHIDEVISYLMYGKTIDITKQIQSAELQFEELDEFLGEETIDESKSK